MWLPTIKYTDIVSQTGNNTKNKDTWIGLDWPYGAFAKPLDSTSLWSPAIHRKSRL